MLKLILIASVSVSTAAVPQVVQTTPCPAPVPVPANITTPNATYYNDGEPPARFAHAPTTTMKLRFGQAAIDEICGRPPCNMRFLGCVRGDDMALLDPFSVSSEQFAKLVRHELAHINGWPATHGD